MDNFRKLSKNPRNFPKFQKFTGHFSTFCNPSAQAKFVRCGAESALVGAGTCAAVLLCDLRLVPRHPTSDQGAPGRALLCKTFPGVGADFAAVQGRLQAVFVVLSLSPLGAFALHQLSIKETFW